MKICVQCGDKIPKPYEELSQDYCSYQCERRAIDNLSRKQRAELFKRGMKIVNKGLIATISLASTIWSHAQISLSLLPKVYASVPAVQPPTYRGLLSLRWTASADTNVVGYTIQYSTNGIFNFSNIVGKVTNATLTGLAEARTYYVQVVSRDKSGIESVPSNVVTNYVETVIGMTPYAYQLSATVKPGSTNVVQESGDAVAFTNSQTIVAGAGGTIAFVRTNTGGSRFVRLRTQ